MAQPAPEKENALTLSSVGSRSQETETRDRVERRIDRERRHLHAFMLIPFFFDFGLGNWKPKFEEFHFKIFFLQSKRFNLYPKNGGESKTGKCRRGEKKTGKRTRKEENKQKKKTVCARPVCERVFECASEGKVDVGWLKLKTIWFWVARVA